MAAIEKNDPTAYVGYLDKEMTIMGVLSAFSVSAAAAVVWKVTGASDKEVLLARMNVDAPWLTFSGTAFVFLAALFFYRQRSLLAYYYGQIVLAASYPKIVSERATVVERLLGEADGWATWLFYRWAFVLLLLGFLGWASALFACRLDCGERWGVLGAYSVVVALALVYMTRVHRILIAPCGEEYPLSLRSFFGFKEAKNKS